MPSDEINEIADLLGIRSEDPTAVPCAREGRKFGPEQTMLCRMLSDSVRAALQGDVDETGWLMSETQSHPWGFTFIEVCQYLHLSPHLVRRLLVRKIGTSPPSD